MRCWIDKFGEGGTKLKEAENTKITKVHEDHKV